MLRYTLSIPHYTTNVGKLEIICKLVYKLEKVIESKCTANFVAVRLTENQLQVSKGKAEDGVRCWAEIQPNPPLNSPREPKGKRISKFQNIKKQKSNRLETKNRSYNLKLKLKEFKIENQSNNKSTTTGSKNMLESNSNTTQHIIQKRRGNMSTKTENSDKTQPDTLKMKTKIDKQKRKYLFNKIVSTQQLQTPYKQINSTEILVTLNVLSNHLAPILKIKLNIPPKLLAPNLKIEHNLPPTLKTEQYFRYRTKQTAINNSYSYIINLLLNQLPTMPKHTQTSKPKNQSRSKAEKEIAKAKKGKSSKEAVGNGTQSADSNGKISPINYPKANCVEAPSQDFQTMNQEVEMEEARSNPKIAFAVTEPPPKAKKVKTSTPTSPRSMNTRSMKNLNVSDGEEIENLEPENITPENWTQHLDVQTQEQIAMEKIRKAEANLDKALEIMIANKAEMEAKEKEDSEIAEAILQVEYNKAQDKIRDERNEMLIQAKLLQDKLDRERADEKKVSKMVANADKMNEREKELEKQGMLAKMRLDAERIMQLKIADEKAKQLEQDELEEKIREAEKFMNDLKERKREKDLKIASLKTTSATTSTPIIHGTTPDLRTQTLPKQKVIEYHSEKSINVEMEGNKSAQNSTKVPNISKPITSTSTTTTTTSTTSTKTTPIPPTTAANNRVIKPSPMKITEENRVKDWDNHEAETRKREEDKLKKLSKAPALSSTVTSTTTNNSESIEIIDSSDDDSDKMNTENMADIPSEEEPVLEKPIQSKPIAGSYSINYKPHADNSNYSRKRFDARKKDEVNEKEPLAKSFQKYGKTANRITVEPIQTEEEKELLEMDYMDTFEDMAESYSNLENLEVTLSRKNPDDSNEKVINHVRQTYGIKIDTSLTKISGKRMVIKCASQEDRLKLKGVDDDVIKFEYNGGRFKYEHSYNVRDQHPGTGTAHFLTDYDVLVEALEKMKFGDECINCGPGGVIKMNFKSEEAWLREIKGGVRWITVVQGERRSEYELRRINQYMNTTSAKWRQYAIHGLTPDINNDENIILIAQTMISTLKTKLKDSDPLKNANLTDAIIIPLTFKSKQNLIGKLAGFWTKGKDCIALADKLVKMALLKEKAGKPDPISIKEAEVYNPNG